MFSRQLLQALRTIKAGYVSRNSSSESAPCKSGSGHQHFCAMTTLSSLRFLLLWKAMSIPCLAGHAKAGTQSLYNKPAPQKLLACFGPFRYFLFCFFCNTVVWPNIQWFVTSSSITQHQFHGHFQVHSNDSEYKHNLRPRCNDTALYYNSIASLQFTSDTRIWELIWTD